MARSLLLLAAHEAADVQVIHARSGKVVVDLDPLEIVMKVMNAHQLYCCRYGGETSIVDVRDGARIDCSLDLGEDPWTRGEHMGFDVSPDGRHAAWSTIEAITVSELRSGIEAARYHVRLGGWTLRFEDDRTIRAEGPFEEILFLRFEASAERT